MKYSKLFGKTVREPKSDMQLSSHKYLYQAGYIRESRAGRYFLLPLGQMVQDRIVQIIEEEMDKAGSQKMFAPVLHPIELWQETNRNDSGGFELMSVTDRSGSQFALGGTAEEMFVDVVRAFQISYKDLPFTLYQFGYKFRDELRARGGLLRVREFLMKDAYSFHNSDDDFKKEYQNLWATYQRIFERLGLDVDVVPADNGYFGGDYCHEFVVESEAGESKYFVSEDGKYIAHEDIATFEFVDCNPEEEVLPLKVIDQPDWVKTMEDNQKHYQLPLYKFLKNVVYKNRVSNEIFIVTIRGDLEVNKNKVEKQLDMIGLLENATDDDLEKIGTKSGYVHAWGHEGCTYLADRSLTTVKNFIGGQKQDLTDTINVNYGRDFKHEIEGDFAVAQSGFLAPGSQSMLVAKCGIEVGNIFQLGQHYSKLMSGAVFTDSDGKSKEYFMGCYGIGVGRVLATIAEKFSDDKGLSWPNVVAPFDVHFISIGTDSSILDKADGYCKKFESLGLRVLYDDRDVRPGVKFADADLLGIPARVVFSEKLDKENKLELKMRSSDDVVICTYDEVINKLT